MITLDQTLATGAQLREHSWYRGFLITQPCGRFQQLEIQAYYKTSLGLGKEELQYGFCIITRTINYKLRADTRR